MNQEVENSENTPATVEETSKAGENSIETAENMSKTVEEAKTAENSLETIENNSKTVENGSETIETGSETTEKGIQTVEKAGNTSEENAESTENDLPVGQRQARSTAELMAIVEALIFVADEPLTTKLIGDIVGEEKDAVLAAVEALSNEYEERGSGLQIREIAGGWQIATRTEYHEEVRRFLKTRPSAKLSLASLETLAVIAYKQPVTVPEILEIRGVQSASAIKTLLEKRLIVTKGHKETVGRPMMYGTSKDFLIQFGLKDLSELPAIEDFEDLIS
ncbi:MAG TPA: SMC-Scp complex subunit ScpB [Pyrinomonadaceae bacterium]|nr:SMC-Scp complex subunit ScpB [Pyrinomonadaceae bacterium]